MLQKSLSTPEKFFLLSLVFNSGTDFSHDYSIAAVCMLLSFMLMMSSREIVFNGKTWRIIFGIVLASCVWFIQYSLYPSSESVSNILKYAVLILMCFCFTASRPERNMMRLDYIIRIIVFFMIITSILFCIDIIGVNLPTISTNDGNHRTFLYIFKVVENPDFGFMGFRNCGMYWEPGMYQIYLNLVLIYYLYKSGIEKRKRFITLGVCGFAIITTGSVTGYVLALLIVVLYIFINSSNSLVKLLLLSVFIFVFMAILPKLVFMFETKTSIEREESSYTMRMADLIIGFELFKQNPIIGYGIDNDMYNIFTKNEFSEVRGNSNGIMNVLINLGIVGFIFYSFCVYKFSKIFSRYLNNKLVIISIIVWALLSAMNEPITFHPFFFFLLGLGLFSPSETKQIAQTHLVKD